MLIGTEGAHSLTREFLVGREDAALIPSPIVGTVSITKLTREAALKIREMHYRYVLYFHPKGYFIWTGGTISVYPFSGR